MGSLGSVVEELYCKSLWHELWIYKAALFLKQCSRLEFQILSTDGNKAGRGRYQNTAVNQGDLSWKCKFYEIFNFLPFCYINIQWSCLAWNRKLLQQVISGFSVKFFKGFCMTNFWQNLFKNWEVQIDYSNFLLWIRKQCTVGLKFCQRLIFCIRGDIFILNTFDFFRWQLNRGLSAMNKSFWGL